MTWKTIYLTGAPAAGKSSVGRVLASRLPDLAFFEYGRRMTAHLNSSRLDEPIVQETLRGGTGRMVSEADIGSVNQEMLDFCRQGRSSRHIIIDSHHVTKEAFGFRVAPFSIRTLQALRLTEIWVVFADAAVTRSRILADSAGRLLPSEFEADFHTSLQSAVAISYSVAAAVPLYLFDATCSPAELAARMEERLLMD